MHRFSPISITDRPVLALALARVPAGFPSPADDYLDEPVDLVERLVPNKAASFLFRIEGRSMEGAGIFCGDVAIIDRSISPRPGHIVVAMVDGGCTIKRLKSRNGVPFLIAEPVSAEPYEVATGDRFEVWGVVRSTITPHLGRR